MEENKGKKYGTDLKEKKKQDEIKSPEMKKDFFLNRRIRIIKNVTYFF